MKKLSLIVILFICTANLFSQSDATHESKFNQSSYGKFPGMSRYTSHQRNYPLFRLVYRSITKMLLTAKMRNLKIAHHLRLKNISKAEFTAEPIEVQITKGDNVPFISDWYGSDVLVMGTEVASSGGYRQIDLKQGEDGWMYMAVNRRNVVGLNGGNYGLPVK